MPPISRSDRLDDCSRVHSRSIQRVITIGGVVAVYVILTLGAIASAAILIDGGITMLHNLAPAAQNRSQQGSPRIGQPALRAVSHILALWQANTVRRAVQDYWKARATILRQKDEGVQPDSVAHWHHRLKASGTFDRLHNRLHLESG
jgi:hypothetical protein